MNGVFNGNKRIGRAGHAHSLINVGTSRKGIADSSAKAGSRTAERLYFRWVVMGLVFEHEQPVLQISVNVHLDLYGAGVYLLGFVQVFQDAVLFQLFCGNCGNVHKSDGFAASAKLFADVYILFIGFSDVVRIDNRVVNGSQERCVAAVI